MPKFEVLIEENIIWSFIVEALSKEEASEIKLDHLTPLKKEKDYYWNTLDIRKIDD